MRTKNLAPSMWISKNPGRIPRLCGLVIWLSYELVDEIRFDLLEQIGRLATNVRYVLRKIFNIEYFELSKKISLNYKYPIDSGDLRGI